MEVFPGIVCRRGDFRHKVVGAWVQPEVLAERFLTGEAREAIAEDYGCSVEHIDTAIRWGLLSMRVRSRRLVRAWAEVAEETKG